MEHELDAARDYYYVIRELVAYHPGGARNESSLATVRRLCRAAAAVGDRECAAALAAIEGHAVQYFSGGPEAAWTRRQLLRELEWFRGCLLALEDRYAAARAPRMRTSQTSRPMSAAPTAAPAMSVITAPGNAPAGMSESRPEAPKAMRSAPASGRMK